MLSNGDLVVSMVVIDDVVVILAFDDKQPCILLPSQSATAKNTSFHGGMSRIRKTATPPSVAEKVSAQCVASGIPDRPMRWAGKPT